MPKGGKRPGAGRPAKADKYAPPIARAEDRIADKLPRIVDKLMELSEGVCFLTDKRNKHVVEMITANIRDPDKLKDILDRLAGFYTVVPDRYALTYLVDRIMGRPTQRAEVEAVVEEKGIIIDI